ncbi:MAG: fibronectin type III domain-containing protein [Verrucomicrobia bacterium]|nr:fibronectin type III domain-containing protein [Verrucomicrobiota bacterium]
MNDRVQTTSNLNIRDAASTNGALLGTATSGSQGQIIGGPINSGGFTWWRVDWDSYSTGWSVETYLTKVAASVPGGFSLSNDAPIWDPQPPAGPAVQLRWTTSSNASSYELYRNGAKIHPSSGTFMGTSFRNETGMTGGQTYSFHVIARNAAGTRQSNTLSITMPTEPPSIPATPGYLEAQVFANRVELGWTDQSTNEQGFKIERRVGSGAWSQVATVGAVSGGDVFWTDTTTQPKTTYSYRVRAYNSLGNSGYTNEATGTTPAGRPGSFTLSNDAPVWDATLPGPKVRLTWTTSADVGNYAIYRNGSLYTAGISGTTFTNQAGLDAGASYTFSVRASNSEGTTDSNTISVTMPPAPPSAPNAPSGLGASTGSNFISLYWTDNSTNETGFKIERRPTTGVGWVALATNGSNATAYADTQIEPGTAYVYRVRAYNSIGPSNYSNEATATSAPPGKPGNFFLSHDAPYWNSASPLGPAVMLRWDAATGATRYEVYRDGIKVFPTTSTPFTGRTFLNNIGLTPGGTHSYYITAINAGGSTQSNTLLVTMPTAPVGSPFISGLTPTSMTGVPLPDRVRIEVRGSDFKTGVRAYLSYTGRSNVLLESAYTEFIDSTRVVLRIATSVEADTWSVQLRNTDNRNSNIASLQVTAPTGAASLTSISPSTTTPSPQERSFTLNGSGFGTSDRVKIVPSSGNPFMLTAPAVQFINGNTLRFTQAFTSAPARASVRVVKPNSTESGPVTLTLDRTLMPDLVCDPASIVVSPSSVAVGGQVQVQCIIRNTGNGVAGSSIARFRLSLDGVLQAQDPPLEPKDVVISEIAPGGFQAVNRSFTVPMTTQPGTYRVGLFVDALNQVPQSNTANDAALDVDRLTVTASPVTPAAPVFTLQPTNTTIDENKALILKAKATGAISYRWRMNGNETAFSASTAADGTTTLKADFSWVNLTGDYQVVAVGRDGLETQSNVAKVSVRSKNISGWVDGTSKHKQVSLSSWGDIAVNPSFPTVVLVHGWQPTGDFSPNGIKEWWDLALDIRVRMRKSGQPNVNVMLYSWADAHNLNPKTVASSISPAAEKLADLLVTRLGTQYQQPIQLIGHSFGSILIAEAMRHLFFTEGQWTNFPTQEGKKMVQLTTLDAAFDLTRYSPCDFVKILKEVKTIAAVDNYYADGWAIDTASGKPIPNAGPLAGGQNVNSEIKNWRGGVNGIDHTEIWNEWYRNTVIDDTTISGFKYSIILNSQDLRETLSKLYPWKTSPSCLNPTVITSNTANSTPVMILPVGTPPANSTVDNALTFSIYGGSSISAVDTLHSVNLPMFTISAQAATNQPLNLVNNASSGSTSIRLGKIEVLHDIAVKAAANSLAVTSPAAKARLLTDRVTVAGRWSSPVGLAGLTIAINGSAPVPVTPATNGAWSVELGPLSAGLNTIQIDAQTIHGQTLSISRPVNRVVPTTFNLAILGQGTVTGARVGPSTLEVGQTVALRATPKAGHVFDHWSDSLSGRVRTATFLMQPGMNVTAHFVPSPFVDKAGSYVANFVASDSAWSGWAQLSLTTQGAVSGSITIAGKRYNVVGQMDAKGSLVMFLHSLNAKFEAQMDLGSSVPSLSVSLLQGDELLAEATATRAAYDGRGLKAPQVGRYTFALDLPPAGSPLPRAYGTGSASVSAAGVVALTARLPDSTAITQSATITNNTQMPVFALTHSSRGWVSGTITLGDGTANTPVIGSLIWAKPATTGAFLPNAWTGTLQVLGSRYTQPTTGQMVIRGLSATGDNLRLLWGTSLAAVPSSANLSLNVSNRIATTTPRVTVSLNTSNGTFTGSAPHPTTGVAQAFSGVMLQHQRSGYGQMRTSTSVSEVSMTPLQVEQPTLLFTDNFDDNNIDTNKWSYSGNTPTEANQRMELRQAITDNGPTVTTTAFPVNAAQKIIIRRKAFVHYQGSNSRPRFLLNIGTLPRFVICYANDNYGVYRYGFYIVRNNTNESDDYGNINTSEAVVPIWDTWFNERLEYNPVTGVLDYFINDELKRTYNVGILPNTPSPTMQMSFHSWGWWTGQQHFFDDLEVSQEN